MAILPNLTSIKDTRSQPRVCLRLRLCVHDAENYIAHIHALHDLRRYTWLETTKQRNGTRPRALLLPRQGRPAVLREDISGHAARFHARPSWHRHPNQKRLDAFRQASRTRVGSRLASNSEPGKPTSGNPPRPFASSEATWKLQLTAHRARHGFDASHDTMPESAETCLFNEGDPVE